MVKSKPDYEKRKIHTASISLRKTIPISVEEELVYFSSMLGLGRMTNLNKQFLMERCELDEKGFDEKIWEFIMEITKIKKGKYSEEFRKFLANKIMEKAEKKEHKMRWEKYVKKEEYK